MGTPCMPRPTRDASDPDYSSFGGVGAPGAQVALFPQQAGLTTVGSAGMVWHQVNISKIGDSVTWTVDGLLLSNADLATIILGGDNIFFGHSDINASSSTDPNDIHLLFTLIDNVRVDEAPPAVPEPATIFTLGAALAAVLCNRYRTAGRKKR